MSMIHSEYSAVINAEPEVIYEILRDYRGGHNAILPKPFFEEMTVLEGGQGAGTVFDLQMNVYGIKKSYQMKVSEPEPGRVLAETDLNTGEGSSFTLQPLENGRQTKVTIANDIAPSSGLMGYMERLTTTPITRHIFKKELENLAAYIKAQKDGVVLTQ